AAHVDGRGLGPLWDADSATLEFACGVDLGFFVDVDRRGTEHARGKYRQRNDVAAVGRRDDRAIVGARKFGNVKFTVGAESKRSLLERQVVDNQLDADRLDPAVRDVPRVDIVAD